MLDVLKQTNSVFDEVYEHPKESSSSIYPDFARTLKTNFRLTHLQSLLKSLLPLSSQSINITNPNTMLNAINWIIELRKISRARKYWWGEPLVNIYDSEFVFEWWRDGKKVTVYLSETKTEFIKVWGADIDSEMEEGIAETSEQIEYLWQWLAS